MGLDEGGSKDRYRSDGEVWVQWYFACLAMQPAIQKWRYVESRHQEIKQLLIVKTVSGWFVTGASFQLFLGGGRKFFLFFNATGLLKNWKKQHFICSNLTLFIVPFFLFSLFLSFLSLFSFFLSFFSFFSFFFILGGGGRRPPQPP